MPNAVDHLEAALARITREDIAALPPARRERLKATLGAWACLCDDLVHRQRRPQDVPAPRAGRPEPVTPSELIAYARARRKWWLLPLLGLFVVAGRLARCRRRQQEP